MDKRLTSQLHDLKLLDNQRKAWLVLSALVVIILGFLIFDHQQIAEYGLLWQIGILGITVTVVWWYWAMRMIAILLQQRIEEVQVLSDLYDSLNEVKQDILDSTTKSVD
jgi:hypothetical protein